MADMSSEKITGQVGGEMTLLICRKIQELGGVVPSNAEYLARNLAEAICTNETENGQEVVVYNDDPIAKITAKLMEIPACETFLDRIKGRVEEQTHTAVEAIISFHCALAMIGKNPPLERGLRNKLEDGMGLLYEELKTITAFSGREDIIESCRDIGTQIEQYAVNRASK